jgi:hypothetical protein
VIERHITLDHDSIQRAIDELNTLKTALDNPGQIVATLAEYGAEAAEEAYGFPVTVDISQHDAEITASHPGLSFMEFGAGLTTDSGNIFAHVVPYPVEVGSYSRAHHGMFAMMLDSGAANPHWEFGGRIYDRIIPMGGMQAADRAIRSNAEEAVREALGL